MDPEGRFSRNEALFGPTGQERIARTRVAIAGLGGLGAHVTQQLAYLGVQTFSLIDPDVVTESNLNRLVGATEEDVGAGVPKVSVGERMIRQVCSDASVSPVVERIAHPEARALIKGADVVFGCVDRDIHRLELIDVSSANQKPYFDLASDTGGQESWYGGRVSVCTGKGCPVCLQLLDQEQMALDRMTPAERRTDELIYGVRRGALQGIGPSVVSLNGVVASLAVTEFMAYVTELREPVPVLTYRGDLGVIRNSLDEPEEDCFYCVRWRAA